MKHITLCADDYGLNAPISQGIIDLLRRQRLSAVSCLVTSPLWPQHASWLQLYRDKVDIGLHFNLTEGKPLSPAYRRKYGESFFSLPSLILQSFFRRLDKFVIIEECEAQLNHFVANMGFLPHFMDGHQHIHQLPVIRDAVLAVYEKHLRASKAYIRSACNSIPSAGWSNKVKRGIIYLCGARHFETLLTEKGIPHNTVFAGIYSFSHASHYAEIFPRFLENIEDKGLIMCHPGLEDAADFLDVIAIARFYEYSYLSSHQFIKDCEAFGVLIKADKLP